MPQHQVDLPPAALSHMSQSATEHVPSNVAPAPFVTHSTSADETLIGHAGQIDYFVYDVTGPQGADSISGFEPGIDVLVFENSLGLPKANGKVDAAYVGEFGTVTLLGVSNAQVDSDHDLLSIPGTFSA